MTPTEAATDAKALQCLFTSYDIETFLYKTFLMFQTCASCQVDPFRQRHTTAEDVNARRKVHIDKERILNFQAWRRRVRVPRDGYTQTCAGI